MPESRTSLTKKPDQAARPTPPPSILMAIRLMYTGAAVMVIYLIEAVVNSGSFQTRLHQAHPELTQGQLHTLVGASVTYNVVAALVSIGFWIGMARASRAAQTWARTASATLFGIYTLLLALSFRQVPDALSQIIAVGVWLVGLAALIMLWRKESTEFFAASARR